MPALPNDRESLLRLAAETERVIGELAGGDGGAAEKQAFQLLKLAAVRVRLGELEEAARLFDDSATALWRLGSPLDLEAAVIASVMQSGVAMFLGRYEEALRIVDRLVEQSGGFPDIELVPPLRSAGVLIWLCLLEEAGESERLYDAAGTALALLDPADSATDREVLAFALLRRASTADQLGHIDEALEMYEKAIAHFRSGGRCS